METTDPSCYCGKPYNMIKTQEQKEKCTSRNVSLTKLYWKPKECGHCGHKVKNVTKGPTFSSMNLLKKK